MNDVRLQEGHPLDSNLRPLKIGGNSSSLELSSTDNGARIRGDLEITGSIPTVATNRIVSETTDDGITIDSNRVGFCSRMETRKAPHFLNDIDSYFFTNVEHFAWWRENLNYNFTKTKLFQFQYKNLKKFLRRDDWGISHSAHIHEPFGYSIFQAVDYGKIPILSEDWLHEIEYPFRASTKEDFEECWKQICKLDVNQRQDYIDYLKDKLIKFTDKKQWVDKYLEIYNS